LSYSIFYFQLFQEQKNTALPDNAGNSVYARCERGEKQPFLYPKGLIFATCLTYLFSLISKPLNKFFRLVFYAPADIITQTVY
ncbi:MAG: hypothetical protein II486_03070, partial [Thermoguttaceae bacterium]|nr:hypothetical protein [Thermoguttaceae bacterium]